MGTCKKLVFICIYRWALEQVFLYVALILEWFYDWDGLKTRVCPLNFTCHQFPRQIALPLTIHNPIPACIRAWGALVAAWFQLTSYMPYGSHGLSSHVARLKKPLTGTWHLGNYAYDTWAIRQKGCHCQTFNLHLLPNPNIPPPKKKKKKKIKYRTL